MIKKVLTAGLFLGGGYFLINKLLPIFSNKSNSLEVNQKEYEVKEFKTRNSGGGGLEVDRFRTKQSISSIDNDNKRSRGDLLDKNNVQSVVSREGGFNLY